MENSEKKTVSRKVIDREVIMRKYHVHIKNFRNLKDVKVTLSPLTILTGENGSGKSTLFKALLFLKHNHDHEAAKKLKYVIDDDINLGGWEHIANDPKKPISIKITEETWGYDHEVEEIYDIDNCPFELNPTEEYAERMWKSLFEETHLTSRENVIDFSAISSKRYRNLCRTKVENSFEFIFSVSGLNKTKISMKNGKVNFSLSYNVPPFTGEARVIHDKVIPPEQADYYVVLSDFRSCFRKNSVNAQEIIANSAFEYLLHRIHVSREKFPGFHPQEAVLWEESFQYDSIFHKYFGLFMISFSAVELEDIRDIISDFTEFVVDPIEKISNWFKQIISFGTTRDIPQPHYFNSQVKDSTFYKVFAVVRKNESTIDFYSNEVVWHFINEFNRYLQVFELGKSLVIEETDIMTTPFIITLSGKKVLLSEASSGTLQLLPILFTLAFNPEGKYSFFIQQPELHLHPRLQAELSTVLINSISPDLSSYSGDYAIGRESMRQFESELIRRSKGLSVVDISWGDQNAKEEKKGHYLVNYTIPTNMIIETHSEHLLKKLQVLVSQGKTVQLCPEGYCSGEDVKLKDALSIYYFAKDKNGNTKAIEMELDDNGFFKTETPKGFFDESLELNRQLLLGRN